MFLGYFSSVEFSLDKRPQGVSAKQSEGRIPGQVKKDKAGGTRYGSSSRCGASSQCCSTVSPRLREAACSWISRICFLLDVSPALALIETRVCDLSLLHCASVLISMCVGEVSLASTKRSLRLPLIRAQGKLLQLLADHQSSTDVRHAQLSKY